MVHTTHESVRQEAYKEGHGGLEEAVDSSEEGSDSISTPKKRNREDDDMGPKRVRVKM